MPYLSAPYSPKLLVILTYQTYLRDEFAKTNKLTETITFLSVRQTKASDKSIGNRLTSDGLEGSFGSTPRGTDEGVHQIKAISSKNEFNIKL